MVPDRWQHVKPERQLLSSSAGLTLRWIRRRPASRKLTYPQPASVWIDPNFAGLEQLRTFPDAAEVPALLRHPHPMSPDPPIRVSSSEVNADGETVRSSPGHQVDDSTLPGTPIAARTSHLDPLLVHPALDLVLVESNEPTDLQKWDPPLGDESLDVTPCNAKRIGHGTHVQQGPISRWMRPISLRLRTLCTHLRLLSRDEERRTLLPVDGQFARPDWTSCSSEQVKIALDEGENDTLSGEAELIQETSRRCGQDWVLRRVQRKA